MNGYRIQLFQERVGIFVGTFTAVVYRIDSEGEQTPLASCYGETDKEAFVKALDTVMELEAAREAVEEIEAERDAKLVPIKREFI